MRICIIGGGVVGLNIALAFCESPRHKRNEIYLFEREKFLGHHTSTRNSEVMHAGLAYPPESLKARLCIEGRRLSYELFKKLGVDFKKCGKWIIAVNDEETDALNRMIVNAHASGAVEVMLGTAQSALSSEPVLKNAAAAAYSPESGIIDCAGYIRALGAALSRFPNMNIVYPCAVTGHAPARLETTRGAIPYDIAINAGGLFADEIYRMSGGTRNFQIIPYKGEYYSWRKGSPGSLIYPVPQEFIAKNMNDAEKTGNFGIHLHTTLAGETLLGPSLVKLAPEQKTDYTIQTEPEEFAGMLADLVKGVLASDLQSAYAGNRPKLTIDGRPAEDFQIFREKDFIHLLGIESPGLTAAPAIARYVMGLV